MLYVHLQVFYFNNAGIDFIFTLISFNELDLQKPKFLNLSRFRCGFVLFFAAVLVEIMEITLK